MRLSEHTTKILMKSDPYYQRRRCSPMSLDSGKFNNVYADIRDGSQDLCKFALYLRMPVSIYKERYGIPYSLSSSRRG